MGLSSAMEASALHPVPAVTSMKEALRSVFTALDPRFRAKDGVTGTRTGIRLVDAAAGLQWGEVLVVAGRPGVGKTSLALASGTQAATAGTPVLFIALGQRADDLAERLLAQVARVPVDSLRKGQLMREDMTSLTEGAKMLAGLPIGFADPGPTTATSI